LFFCTFQKLQLFSEPPGVKSVIRRGQLLLSNTPSFFLLLGLKSGMTKYLQLLPPCRSPMEITFFLLLQLLNWDQSVFGNS